MLRLHRVCTHLIRASERKAVAAPLFMGAQMRLQSGQAMRELRPRIQEAISEMKASGTYKVERVITTQQDSEIGVQESKEPVLNFCANNYLGK
jgi:CRISPR/Cas system-associated protein Cas5 (RAMP superfamily)